MDGATNRIAGLHYEEQSGCEHRGEDRLEAKKWCCAKGAYLAIACPLESDAGTHVSQSPEPHARD